MININQPQICHPMMIGTKRNQIGRFIRTAFSAWSDVMNVHNKIKAANYTTMVISNFSLCTPVLMAAPVPIAVVDSIEQTRIMLALTKTITKIELLYLTGEAM